MSVNAILNKSFTNPPPESLDVFMYSTKAWPLFSSVNPSIPLSKKPLSIGAILPSLSHGASKCLRPNNSLWNSSSSSPNAPKNIDIPVDAKLSANLRVSNEEANLLAPIFLILGFGSPISSRDSFKAFLVHLIDSEVNDTNVPTKLFLPIYLTIAGILL